jgi:hypothetical protein
MHFVFKWILSASIALLVTYAQGEVCVTNQVVNVSGKLEQPLDLDSGFNNALLVQVSKPGRLCGVSSLLAASLLVKQPFCASHFNSPGTC